MKRLHIHVAVDSLESSIGFYKTLFGAAPDVSRSDYAKWMLDDPRVNFAISQRGRAAGIDHLGIQVDSGPELVELAGRLKAAGETTADQTAANCCYAVGDKSWVGDPSGVRWEVFHTTGAAEEFGADIEPAPRAACCAPARG
jgi:hypothetical protein